MEHEDTQAEELEVQLESCRRQRDQADAMNKRVWTEAIDYLLTRIMERDYESSRH